MTWGQFFMVFADNHAINRENYHNEHDYTCTMHNGLDQAQPQKLNLWEIIDPTISKYYII